MGTYTRNCGCIYCDCTYRVNSNVSGHRKVACEDHRPATPDLGCEDARKLATVEPLPPPGVHR